MDKTCFVCQTRMNCMVNGVTVVLNEHYSNSDLYGCPNCHKVMIFGINPNWHPVDLEKKFDCRLKLVELDWAAFGESYGDWQVIVDFKGKFSLAVKSYMEEWERNFPMDDWEWLS